MAYTTPRTWVAGEIVDKDMMNEQVRDNIAYLKNLADDNTQNISRLDGRIGDVENTLDELDVPDIGDLESRVGVNETDIGLLDGRVGVNETDIGLLDGRVTATETNIGTINNTTLKSVSLTRYNYYSGGSFVRNKNKNQSYQNTSGKIRLVTVDIFATAAEYDMAIYVQPTALPASPTLNDAGIIISSEFPSSTRNTSFTFIVPPNYYYMLYIWEQTEVAYASSWVEFDLF